MTFAEMKSRRWTREEYCSEAEKGAFEGLRVELIRGELHEMTPQDPLHTAGVEIVAMELRRVIPGEFTVREEKPLRLGVDSEPEPDVAVVAGSPRGRLHTHPSTAELVVEVARTSHNTDRTTKASLYAESMIQEYWIVDLVDRRLEVYREPTVDPKVGPGYRSQILFGPDETVSPLAFPGVAIPVSDLLP